MAEDPFRSLFHFSSPKGKLWEPGGFCKWKGRYHLYYFGKYGLFYSPRIIKPDND
jgi:sucrose-6-phosphate hydrolase SacC (GH32 family)